MNNAFTLANMKGRPVFIRSVKPEDLLNVEVAPNFFTSKIDGFLCEDCHSPADQLVYELDGSHWAWCGECDPGG